MGDIIKMADKTYNSQHQSPKQILQEALEDDDFVKAEKLLIISADNVNGGNIGYINSRLSAAEIVVVCEVMKVLMMEAMGYINHGD